MVRLVPEAQGSSLRLLLYLDNPTFETQRRMADLGIPNSRPKDHSQSDVN